MLALKLKNGFSLVEMAISLIIVGVILGASLAIYNNYQTAQKVRTSYANIRLAVDSIHTFRTANGRFPCPAPLTVPRGVAGYGSEGDCAFPGAAAPGNIATPLSAQTFNSGGGYFVGVSFRSAALLALPASPRVIIGAIPFRALQMEEKKTFDAYGDRLLYSVTESMTDENTISDNNGAIAVNDSTGTSVVSTAGSAGFMVLSHGSTRAGAYTKDGVQVQACPGAGASLDSENCDNDSIFVSSLMNEAPGNTFFDDMTVYFSRIYDPQWKRTTADPEDIEDLSPNFVGIGQPTPGVALDVSTAAPITFSLRAYGNDGTDGRIMIDDVCDENGANCFKPELIGGNNVNFAIGEGMLCNNPGEYMTGIQNSAPICESITVECPDATPVLVAINPDGTPDCRATPDPSCAADTMTVCAANDVPLFGPISDGQLSAVHNVGDCRAIQYRCNAGAWNVSSDTGACNFVPTVTTVSGNDCGTGYGGSTYTIITTTTCVGGSTSVDTSGVDCVCVGTTVDETSACSAQLGAGWTGGPATRTVTYDSTTCLPDDPAWDTSTCVCRADDDQTAACSAVLNSNWTTAVLATRTVTYSLPNCLANNPAWDTSACFCRNPVPQTLACSDASLFGAGYAGTATRTVTYSGPGCNPDNPAWDTTTCGCGLVDKITTANHDCAEEYSGAELGCYEPDPGDLDEFLEAVAADGSCTHDPIVRTKVGSCRTRSFKWSGSHSGSTGGTWNGKFLGEACNCQDHIDTLGAGVKTCFDQSDNVNRGIYNCDCN